MKRSDAKRATDFSPEDVETSVRQVKSGMTFGAPKSPELNILSSIIFKLNSFPKNKIIPADFTRVRNQVLDRISIPQPVSQSPSWFTSLPRLIKISAATLGSILIVASLTIGIAVAALESAPGQSIYPLKKIVENIQLRLASDEEEKAVLQVKFADKRLEELEKVLEQNKSGSVSSAQVSKAVADLQKTTVAAVTATSKTKSAQPKVAILTKLVQQSALLKTAAIESEGEVKVELEKALEATKISQEEAIANLERAGLKVETTPIIVEEKEETEEPTPAEETKAPQDSN